MVSKLAEIGPGMAGTLNTPFPTFSDAAWAFRDAGRAREFVEDILDQDPIGGPWNDAGRAICSEDPSRAGDILDEMGHTAAAAYARLRAVEMLADDRAREKAETYYRAAGATWFLRRLDGLARATAG